MKFRCIKKTNEMKFGISEFRHTITSPSDSAELMLWSLLLHGEIGKEAGSLESVIRQDKSRNIDFDCFLEFTSGFGDEFFEEEVLGESTGEKIEGERVRFISFVG